MTVFGLTRIVKEEQTMLIFFEHKQYFGVYNDNNGKLTVANILHPKEFVKHCNDKGMAKRMFDEIVEREVK